MAKPGFRETFNSWSLRKRAVVIFVWVVLALALAQCALGGPSLKADNKSNKQSAIGLYKTVRAITRECDSSAGNMAEKLKGSDMVAAYRAADQAASNCLGLGRKIAALAVPDGFDEKRSADAASALEVCSNAYLNKWSAANSLKDILDGDVRPSVRADMQDSASQSKAGTFLCSARLAYLATSYGATELDLK